MSSGNAQQQSLGLPSCLDAVRIRELPAAAYYVANFLSEDEETQILDKITSAPKPRWKQLAHRRLQTWPSDLVNDKLIDAPLPDWLTEPIVSRLQSIPVSSGSGSTIFSASPHQGPNHVLINEYPPGVGIMPHKDGTAYHPAVCTVSLGASLCLNIHQSKDDGAVDPVPVWRIMQEPRSLLITTSELYTTYLHGIADIENDTSLSPATVANWDLLGSHFPFQDGHNARGCRTSLTYRDVIKVSKLGKQFSLFRK